jgi:hypothetical protein
MSDRRRFNPSSRNKKGVATKHAPDETVSPLHNHTLDKHEPRNRK